MRIAIAQVDGKWPNLALAKYARWGADNGHEVFRYDPAVHRRGDLVIASKIFTDTPDDPSLPPGAYSGGSGYSLRTSLAPEVEALRPDWSLWPEWDRDMGFTTRGCVRRCPFCIVPQKEGGIRIVAEFGDIWTGRPEVTLLDNNLTAAPIEHFRGVFADARKARVKLVFGAGALDARLWSNEHQAIVKEFSPVLRRFHFAFDAIRDEKAVRRLISMWTVAGMHPDRLVFFVLVGYDTTPEEDAYRVNLLISLRVNPFVMPFDRTDHYQARLARWCNSVVARKQCSFEEFSEQARRKIRAEAMS